MKKILTLFLFLIAGVLPIFAQDCSRYSQYSPKQQILFYVQDNNEPCIKELLNTTPVGDTSLIYWTTDDMCVDLLFYWVYKGKDKIFANIADAFIAHGADMTRLFCKRTAIKAAADLAIEDIIKITSKKGYYDDSSERVKRFSYLLQVGSKNDVINKISSDFLQNAISTTGNKTNSFVSLLLKYGIKVTDADIDYAYNNGYGEIYEMLRQHNSGNSK